MANKKSTPVPRLSFSASIDAMNEKLIELISTVCMEHEMETMKRMTPDEIMDHLGCSVDADGEILDADENPTGIWYEQIK